jgi:hypothetical protein
MIGEGVMKNKSLIAMFILLAIIFFLSQSSFGIEVEKCKVCHGNVKPLSAANLTKDCMACHGPQAGHYGTPPDTRVPQTVHAIHGSDRIVSSLKACNGCHHNYPIECVNCHNLHDNIGSVQISGINTSECTDCHGQLPTPEGHSDHRDALSNSKHKWMNCQTCHINQYNVNNSGQIGFYLHFKDLTTIPINNSINLCKICHSLQYSELQGGTHGDVNKTCVDCHNPHTTSLSGSTIQATPKAPPGNVSTTIDSAENWATTKLPILKNNVAMAIIIIIIAMTVGEYLLSIEEKGKKTAYHTVKIHSDEDVLKTLEITLGDKDISVINDILATNNVDIMGMTMTKEDEDINTYKCVIFVNIKEPIDEDSLISQLTVTRNVRSAVFTDKYEL